MRIRLLDRCFVFLVRLIDMFQSGILGNYALFSFIISRAPQKMGAKACYYRAFREFLIARRDVPAYRDFLARCGWVCKFVRSRDIFESLPVMDKPNYILSYATEERCLDGEFFHEGVAIDESSGSTG